MDQATDKDVDQEEGRIRATIKALEAKVAAIEAGHAGYRVRSEAVIGRLVLELEGQNRAIGTMRRRETALEDAVRSWQGRVIDLTQRQEEAAEEVDFAPGGHTYTDPEESSAVVPTEAGTTHEAGTTEAGPAPPADPPLDAPTGETPRSPRFQGRTADDQEDTGSDTAGRLRVEDRVTIAPGGLHLTVGARLARLETHDVALYRKLNESLDFLDRARVAAAANNSAWVRVRTIQEQFSIERARLNTVCDRLAAVTRHVDRLLEAERKAGQKPKPRRSVGRATRKTVKRTGRKRPTRRKSVSVKHAE